MREGIENCRRNDRSQSSFASAEYAMQKKRTRREKFLAEMERVVPWARLIAVIEPLYHYEWEEQHPEKLLRYLRSEQLTGFTPTSGHASFNTLGSGY
ncbi:hypothetical protein [Variovorax ginsengisoli]|uniref:Uncharacterized protein n=1 Tax=Variovorax ginsengisoli TaxID=363844 RepID=A0ABT9SF66_9BURK|nr:hypothetical protein [Variovorax ginsengisoli]MDP9903008.1 hypothetical protein [Variovorax ginsengisoli]